MIDQSALEDLAVLRQQCAALARGDDLVIVEGEGARITDRCEALPLKGAAVTLAGILQNEEAVLLRDRHDLIHCTGEALDMHGDDRLGRLRDLSLNIVGIDRKALVDLCDHGDRTCGNHGNGGRDVGVGRDDDLVTGTDAHTDQGGGKSGVSARHHQRIGNAELLAHLCLEIFRFPELSAVDLKELL